MNQEELQKKREDIENSFNEKKAAREDLLSKAASLLEEMNQMQGAYNVLSELIEASVKEKK